MIRGVAQLASALAWGARGRKFESSHPDYFTVMVIIFERGFRVTLFCFRQQATGNRE